MLAREPTQRYSFKRSSNRRGGKKTKPEQSHNDDHYTHSNDGQTPLGNFKNTIIRKGLNLKV